MNAPLLLDENCGRIALRMVPRDASMPDQPMAQGIHVSGRTLCRLMLPVATLVSKAISAASTVSQIGLMPLITKLSLLFLRRERGDVEFDGVVSEGTKA